VAVGCYRAESGGARPRGSRRILHGARSGIGPMAQRPARSGADDLRREGGGPDPETRTLVWYARKVNRSVRTPAIGSSGWAGVEEVAGCNEEHGSGRICRCRVEVSVGRKRLYWIQDGWDAAHI
jgi:hypothetical protein